jgi:hypothetical protein
LSFFPPSCFARTSDAFAPLRDRSFGFAADPVREPDPGGVEEPVEGTTRATPPAGVNVDS